MAKIKKISADVTKLLYTVAYAFVNRKNEKLGPNIFVFIARDAFENPGPLKISVPCTKDTSWIPFTNAPDWLIPNRPVSSQFFYAL